jgi:catechol 2,3-dioxygenase-like lactoylglutathione lyase family enzyme
MGLSSYKVIASVAVSDMDRAGEFYEEKLGLSGVEDAVTTPRGDGKRRRPHLDPHTRANQEGDDRVREPGS